MRQRILFTLIATSAFLFIFQEIVRAEKYFFKIYTTDDGLESNYVSAISQDRNGYLWLGTPVGVCKFDGVTFTTYSTDDGLAGNNVFKIKEDSKGNLWFSSWGGGISKFDGETWTTHTEGVLGSYDVWSVIEDSSGHMWFGTYGGGVCRYDGANWIYYTTSDGLGDDRVRTIFEDSKGNLWFGLQRGISSFDGNTWNTYNTGVLAPPCHINSILEDKKGNLWLGGYGGPGIENIAIKITGAIESADYKVFSLKDGVPAGSDPYILEDSQGNIWLASGGGGLGIYNGQNWNLYTKENGLPSNQITSIYEDNERNLWFGTGGDGVARLSGTAFVTYTTADGLPENSIAPILEDSKGNVWFNDRYIDGVTKYDGEKWNTYTTKDGLADNQIVGIFEDSKGTMWFSTGEVLNRFDGHRWRHYSLGEETDDPWFGSITFEDKQGNLWFGMSYRFDGKSFKPYLKSKGEKDLLGDVKAINTDKIGNYLFGGWQELAVFNGTALRHLNWPRGIKYILKDSQQNLWFATDNGVIVSDIDDYFKYAGENQRIKGKHYTTEDGLAHNDVWTIFQETSGAVWMGTNGGGVSRFDGTRFTNYTIEDGLSSNICYCIVENDERLYFVTPKGLCRFDGEKFNVYSSDEGFTATRHFRPLQDSKGNLWFKSPNGVIKYNPRADRPTLLPPPVYITKLRIQDEDTTVISGMKLSYDKNNLRIDYVGICFAAPENVLYGYKLEGLDKDWAKTYENYISYPYLPPGKYAFKVRARNKDGIWSEQTAELSFEILPPFWATIWFKGLVVALLLVFSWGIHAVRTRYIRKRNLELLHEITERKKAETALRKEHAEVERLKNRLQAENIYLQEEIKIEHSFEEIISNSDGLNKILEKVEQVASTDATVLVLGETGTGKQLIAHAVHNVSPLADRPLITVNCAALPSSLIESELYGHEKGAFTGAYSRKIGRFELADGGSIFLDEVSELPLELQAKLLRVLQDGEFERLGSSQTIKVNVRVIAATNRDLQKEVKEGRFREDLFYRLNVYPIKLPPLREHKEDIPLLVNYFINKYGAKTGKKIKSIPQNVMNSLESYHWPGNVRELKNVIERGMIVSRGNQLELGEWLKVSDETKSVMSHIYTLEEIERAHIRKVLELTGWRVRGKSGTAELLGMKPTTLESRMEKLGIKRKE